VVATHSVRRDSSTPARPVVALLTNRDGKPLAAPRHLDLAQADQNSIVRTLTRNERATYLDSRIAD
jgi:hypothetical protein